MGIGRDIYLFIFVLG